MRLLQIEVVSSEIFDSRWPEKVCVDMRLQEEHPARRDIRCTTVFSIHIHIITADKPASAQHPAGGESNSMSSSCFLSGLSHGGAFGLLITEKMVAFSVHPCRCCYAPVRLGDELARDGATTL